MPTKTKKQKTSQSTMYAARNFLIQDAASGRFVGKNDELHADIGDVPNFHTYEDAQDAQDCIDQIAEEVDENPKHKLAGLTLRVYDRTNPPTTEEASETPAWEDPQPDLVAVTPDYEIVDEPVVVQGELLPADAGVAAPAPVTGTLVLSSPGGALMTATALKAHAADLKKLAKGARDLSQHKEALTFEQNATMIEETLLVQLEPQAKLPFGYADVKKALGDRISGKLRSQLVTAIKRDTPIIEGDTSGKERAAKIEQKIDDFEALVGNVASIVTALVEPVISQAAEKGMLAGRMARETTADVLALEALETVNNA